MLAKDFTPKLEIGEEIIGTDVLRRLSILEEMLESIRVLTSSIVSGAGTALEISTDLFRKSTKLFSKISKWFVQLH